MSVQGYILQIYQNCHRYHPRLQYETKLRVNALFHYVRHGRLLFIQRHSLYCNCIVQRITRAFLCNLLSKMRRGTTQHIFSLRLQHALRLLCNTMASYYYVYFYIYYSWSRLRSPVGYINVETNFLVMFWVCVFVVLLLLFLIP